MKTCTKCKIEKEFSEFNIHTGIRYRSRCKICENLYKKENHLKNKEKATTQRALYREVNRTLILQKKKKYYENNREVILKDCKKYREENKK